MVVGIDVVGNCSADKLAALEDKNMLVVEEALAAG